MRGAVAAMMLRATISKAVAAMLRWLSLALSLGWPSREAAATALLRLWRPLLGRASAPWSELQPELLGLVLSRVPSHADRVRLHAVCRQWRLAPLPPPPPFPWIVLRDDTFLTLPDRALHRLPRHPCHDVIVTRVSTGSMLFLGHSGGRCCLVNPSSGETTPLKINRAGYNYCMIRKVQLFDHIVVFLIGGKLIINPREPRRGARHMTWPSPANSLGSTVDVAVFQGKLYDLTERYNVFGRQRPELHLHLLDINDEQNCVRSVQCISATPTNAVDPWLNAIRTSCLFFYYLVASGDRLLMVEWQIDVEEEGFFYPIGLLRPIHTQFEVSEAVDLIDGHGRWSKVDTLNGRALFVSRECSESLPAHRGGAREDCIYFMTESPISFPGLWGEPDDDLLDCVLYNVRDGTMEPFTSETGAARDGLWQPTWLFPTDV